MASLATTVTAIWRLGRDALAGARAGWRVRLGVACAAPLLFLLAVSVAPTRPNLPFAIDDGALLELATLHASRLDQLLGAPSRFGWSHPGPIFFYFAVPFYMLSDRNTWGMHTAAIAINCLAVVGTLAVVARRAPAALFGTLAVGMALYLRHMGLQLWMSTWNPYTPVLSLPLLLVVGAAVASGSAWLLPVAALVASFLAQTHAGFVPVALVVPFAALVLALQRGHVGWRSIGPIASALVTLGVVWAPPFYEQITRRPGNLAEITDSLLVRGQVQPLSVSVEQFARQLAWPVADVAPTVAWLYVTVAGVELALLACAYALSRDRDRFGPTLGLLTALASVTALVATTRVRGPLYEYLIYWVSALGLLTAVLLAERAVSWAACRTTSLRLGVAAGVAVVIVSAANLGDAVGTPLPGAGTAPDAATVARLVAERLDRAGASRPLVRIATNDVWPEAFGIVLYLYKNGHDVAVDPAWARAFGKGFMPDGSEWYEIVVGDTSTHEVFSGDAGYELVGQSGSLVAYATARPSAHPTTWIDGRLILKAARLGTLQVVRPGDSIPVDVEATVAIRPDSYLITATRMLDGRGQIVAEATDVLPDRTRPLDQPNGSSLTAQPIVRVPDDAAPGAYRLAVLFFRIPSWATVPIRSGGQAVDAVTAGSVVIAPPGWLLDSLPPAARPVGASFGGLVELMAADPSAPSGRSLATTLYWRALRSIDRDYTIFMQLLDADQRVVGQSDGFAWNGRYPTSAWDAGRIVRDTRTIALPAAVPRGTYRLIAGLYRLDTMQRLPLVDPPGGRPTDFVSISDVVLP